MKKILMTLAILGALGVTPCLAVEQSQRDGLFRMDIPQGWHWVEESEEIMIALPDNKTMGIDIKLAPTGKEMSKEGVKKALKEADDQMKKAVRDHQGTVTNDREINLSGVDANRLDFKTGPMTVTCIAFFNKEFVFTITYGSSDPKMHATMDDIMATIKFD